MALGPKQNRFIAEYLKDLNGTQAAIRSGYPARSADVTASRLLANAKVRRAVDDALQRRAERVEIKADDILRELLILAKVDIGEAFDSKGRAKKLKDMPASCRRAISAIEVEELYEGSGENRVNTGRIHKFKFWSKDKALELALRHLGLLNDKLKVDLNESLEQLIKDAMKPPEVK